MTEVKTRTVKPAYRSEGSPLLTEIPADWNLETHRLLGRKDFAAEAMPTFFEWQADRCESQANDLREQAAQWRISGGKSTAGKQKRYVALLSKIEELKAELASGGVDLEALEASI